MMARLPIGLRGGLAVLASDVARQAAFSDPNVPYVATVYRDLFLASFDALVAGLAAAETSAALGVPAILSRAQIAQNEREALVSDILSAAHAAETGAA